MILKQKLIFFKLIENYNKFYSQNDKFNYGFFRFLGLHILRILISHLRTKFGRLLVYEKNKEFEDFYKCNSIIKNGYVTLDNFLGDEESKRLSNLISSIEGGNPPENSQIFDQDGASYVFVDITKMSIVDDAKQEAVNTICRQYLGQKSISNLRFWLHGVEDAKNSSQSTNADINLVWHTDTFHPTLKGFLYLKPLAKEDGPFEFCSGGHRLTLRRIFFEYFSSLRFKSSQGFRAPNALKIYPNTEVQTFSNLGNSLIIADTFGFHRRGERTTKGKRYSLHISCRTNPFVYSV